MSKKKFSKVGFKVDESSQLKKEIQDLENKKTKTGKGVRGFLRNLAINKEISDKKGFITAKDKIRSANKKIELINMQVKLENAKANLQKARKKSQVSFDGIMQTNKKELNMEDIFNGRT